MNTCEDDDEDGEDEDWMKKTIGGQDQEDEGQPGTARPEDAHCLARAD